MEKDAANSPPRRVYPQPPAPPGGLACPRQRRVWRPRERPPAEPGAEGREESPVDRTFHAESPLARGQRSGPAFGAGSPRCAAQVVAARGAQAERRLAPVAQVADRGGEEHDDRHQ
jgi:hypothetical protein